MWVVAIEADTTKLEIAITLESCVYFAAEKKDANKVATEALRVYQLLKAAVTKLDLLALQQTQWEEGTQKQVVIQAIETGTRRFVEGAARIQRRDLSDINFCPFSDCSSNTSG
jgi:hypothetical protein